MEIPVKIEISRLISSITDKDIIRILIKARNKLNVCPHCEGETDEHGDCLHTW